MHRCHSRGSVPDDCPCPPDRHSARERFGDQGGIRIGLSDADAGRVHTPIRSRPSSPPQRSLCSARCRGAHDRVGDVVITHAAVDGVIALPPDAIVALVTTRAIGMAHSNPPGRPSVRSRHLSGRGVGALELEKAQDRTQPEPEIPCKSGPKPSVGLEPTTPSLPWKRAAASHNLV